MLSNYQNQQTSFKHGSIVRVELENFMTYKHIDFYPGPYLNIILGPNGSGKSAIVCSIIMGFGGDPSITGRSQNLGDYVRKGANIAKISIEVYSAIPNSKNYLVQREIHTTIRDDKRENHNKWKLNGQPVNKAQIQEFTKELNIDISNLCQVLPQERVAEFSKMGPPEMLLSTEKSIGDIEMHGRHIKLISLSEEVTEFERSIKNCKAMMLKCQNFKTNIEPDLKLIKQKEKFEEEISWLLKKQVWLEFEEKRLIYQTAKEEFMQKKKEYDKFEKNLKPMKDNIQKTKEKLEEIKANKLKSGAKIKEYYSKITDCFKTMDHLQNQINARVDSYHEQMSEHKRSLNRLDSYEKDYNNYKNDLLNMPNKNEYSSKMNELNDELKSIDKQVSDLRLEIGRKKHQNENYQNEKRLLESKMNSIKNLFKVRMDKINESDPNARKAFEWFQKNKELFSGRVFPPMITQINVIRDEWVNYVEAAIGGQDMGTFLFEKIEDLELFSGKLKQDHDIRVNVAMVPRDWKTIIENRSSEDLKPYKKFGIFATVSDLLEAPEQVMAYLIKTYHIDTIPVGDNITDRIASQLIDSSSFKRIITKCYIYSIVTSLYDREKSTRISPMNQAKFLNVIIDRNEIDEIKKKIAKIQNQIDSNQSFLQEKTEQFDSLNKTRSQRTEIYSNFEKKKNEIIKIEAKIQEKERQINLLKKSLKVVDKYKENLQNDLTKIHEEQLKLLKQVPKILEECANEHQTVINVDLKIEFLNTLKGIYENKLSQVTTEEKSKKTELAEFNTRLQKAKEEAKEYKNKAEEKSGFDLANISEELQAKMSELPLTLPEVIDSISVLKMRCQGIRKVDPSLLEDYRKYQKEIEEKSVQCEELEKRLSAKKEEINSLKPIWIRSLQSLIDKINKNFNNFMEYLHYSGEIYLSMNNEDKFDDYGIGIRVKFRDEEERRDLNAYHQSGGERSVSTMIYMLSLQELAHVPFRIVDEINQGMDEKNERCVFDLIAQVSEKNSSQYFLLSPKLLPNLNYTREMKIHIIFNGPHCHVNFNKVLRDLLTNELNQEDQDPNEMMNDENE